MNPRVADWLALRAIPGLGPSTLAPLVARWREHQAPVWPDGWLAALPAALAQPLRLWLDHPGKSPLAGEIEAALAWEAESPRHHLLHPGHPAWPALLDQLPDPPVILWAKGDLAALTPPLLAMVGTRRPTREGRDNAAAFARELVTQGLGIASGMALGIDGIAQHAALQAGGRTVGVLGCGVEVIYPPRHAGLYRALVEEGGLLLSEHPAETRAHSRFFPRRNRLITGLSLGVLVVEAAEKSGSLISARLGLEQGRDVFAIPGSIHNPQAGGCLRLIQRGEAALVQEVGDVLAELGHWDASAATAADRTGNTSTPGLATPEERQSSLNELPVDQSQASSLLAHLSDAPTPVDLLVEATGQGVGELQLALLELELEGRVAQTSGGWVRRGR
ncbi:DNA-processing protein DprA [Salinicola aestuarinus]|uniref:DNA-processing protein DprA n=1 Tax=Salinicola aestuarinus TaxID=1949082 RepID=UPI001FD9315E|nr:DNA-processing protein DprA [Salinicola aestuarinus]